MPEITRAEHVRIEADESGFELWLWVDQTPPVDNLGRMVVNVQGIAEDLAKEVLRVIGPWLAEKNQAKDEWRTMRPSEDNEPWPGESAQDFYERTGNDEPLREQADTLIKRIKEYGR